MKFFNQLTLRLRLFVVLGCVALLGIGAGLINLKQVSNLVASLKEDADEMMPKLRRSMDADMSHDCARAALFRAIIGFQNSNQVEVVEGTKEFNDATRSFAADLDEIAKQKLNAETRGSLVELQPLVLRYTAAGNDVLSDIQKNDRQKLAASVREFQGVFETLAVKMEAFSSLIEKEINESKSAASTISARARWIILIGSALTVLLAVFASWVLDRQVSQPVAACTETLNEAGEGVRHAFQQISQNSQTVAEAASQQAASLEETSASLEEVSAMVKRNAESASSSKALSQSARTSAANGLDRIAELGGSLSSIKLAVGEMESAVNEMQGSSQEIAKIIKTIDEIAFQTNLLALNAAVEAARAGEAGAGFAVVADEVRSLAQRSAQAARDTSEKIESAVRRSQLGGVASKKVVQSLGEIEGSARSIEEVFNGIVGQIKTLDETIGEITAASREQSQGIGEVNMAVSQMDKVTQSNAAAAEENASAAMQLSEQVTTLQNVMVQLKTVVGGATSIPGPVAQAAPSGPAPVRPAARSQRKAPPVSAPPGFTRQPKHQEIPLPELAGKADGNFKDF